MKKMLKPLALLLVVLISITAISACGKAQEQPQGTTQSGTSSQSAASTESTAPVETDPYAEKVSLSYLRHMPAAPDQEDAIIKAVEEKFNVEIEMLTAPWGEYMNTVNTKLAAGEEPNVFGIFALGRSTTMKILAEDKAIAKLSDYLQDYPNIQSYLTSRPEIKALYADANGDYYCLPPDYGQRPHAFVVRKDWMDKLNLKMPATYDEFAEMLATLIKNDPDGKGTTGISTHAVDFLNNIVCSFTGKSDALGYIDSKLTYVAYYPGFKEGLKYLASLYERKLLDQEFGIMTQDVAYQKWVQGKAAVTAITVNANWYNKAFNKIKEVTPHAEGAFIMPIPQALAGSGWVGSFGFLEAMVISGRSSEEQVKRALAIMDWSLSEEGYGYTVNGVEGIDYTLKDGKVEVIQEGRARDFAGLDSSVMGYMGLKFANGQDVFPDSAKEYIKEILKKGITSELQVFPPLDNTADNDALTQYGTNVGSVFDSWRMKFIVNEKSVDKDWDEFLKELDKAGLAKWLELAEKYQVKIK